MIEYALTTWSNVVVIPWPKEAVANGHFPQVKLIGLPTSSISKSIFSNMPSFDKNNLNFSCPTFWPILTDPIFPDLIRICSAVRSVGISLSYSLIGNPEQVKDFGKLINLVSGSITFHLKLLLK